MRIGVFTDIHANLPAVESVLGAFRDEGCDLIVHTGDAVGYGPHPREVVETLVGLKSAQLIMGNHDEYAVQGVDHLHMAAMDSNERKHQVWLRAQLPDELVQEMATWTHRVTFAGPTGLVFCHYARNVDGTDFAPILRNADPDEFDGLFDPPAPAIVFHGHDHRPVDVQGRNRFVNPGSAGMWGFPVARYAIVTVSDRGNPDVRFGLAPYDSEPLLRDLERRNVPAREYVIGILRGHS